MEYFNFFPNATVSIGVIEYLTQHPELFLDCVTVVHFPEGWLIRIRLTRSLASQLEANFLAVMSEFGEICIPSIPMRAAFNELSEGQTPTKVMQQYGIAIVAHGKPDRTEIEDFRQQFIQGVGTCPKSLR
jgi:hypothetical protein